MAYQPISGLGIQFPTPQLLNPSIYTAPALSNIGQIDDTAEKLAMIGRVFTYASSAKEIQKIHFMWGSTMTLTGGGTPTTIRVSIQDMSTSTYSPDGSVDEYYDMVNGADTMTASTWVSTGNLSANRSVNNGDLICVVFAFQTFNSGDVVTLTGLNTGGWTLKYHQCYPLLYTTSWSTVLDCQNNIILEFSDGTFGTLFGSQCYSSISTLTYNNSSDPDEYANVYSFPFPIRVSGCWFNSSASKDYSVILTCGASTLSVDVDGDQRLGMTNIMAVPFSSTLEIAANTSFYLSFRPDTNNDISVYQLNVNNANFWKALNVGSLCGGIVSRTNGGAWSAATTTGMLCGGIFMDAFSDGVGSGGSSPRFGDMTGGLR